MCKHTYTRTNANRHVHKHSPNLHPKPPTKHTRTRMHAHTHTHSHTRMHTHTHTHPRAKPAGSSLHSTAFSATAVATCICCIQSLFSPSPLITQWCEQRKVPQAGEGIQDVCNVGGIKTILQVGFGLQRGYRTDFISPRKNIMFCPAG